MSVRMMMQGRKPAGGGITDPTDIPGLHAWWDVSDLTTTWQDTAGTTQANTNGAPLQRIDDKSGNGRHLQQGTNNPTLRTGVQNGLAVARFFFQFMASVAAWSTLSQPNTITAVFDRGRPMDSGSGGRQILGNSIYAGSASIGSISLTAGTFRVVTGIFNGASSAIYDNGSLHASGNPGSNSLGSPRVATDGSSRFDGDLCEMVVYSGALSASARGDLENYLANKWGITL